MDLMQKRWKIAASALLCLVTASFAAGGAALASEGSRVVIQQAKADLTGDGVADTLVMTGSKESPDSPYIRNIELELTDGKSKETVRTPIGDIAEGYNPKFTLLDADHDGVDDVFVAADTGGSGGIVEYSLITFKGGKPAELVPQQVLNDAPQFDVTFEDGFKAKLVNKQSGKSTTVDISRGKDNYLQLGIYDEQGKLLKPVQGWADGYGLLEPQKQADGSYVFEGVQQVAGAAHVDRIATVYSRWAIQDGQWTQLGIEIQGVGEQSAGDTNGASGGAASTPASAATAPPVPILDPASTPTHASPDATSSTWSINGLFAPAHWDIAPNTYVLDAKSSDVTGDGTVDNVILIGRKDDAASVHATDIMVAVMDGASGEYAIRSVGDMGMGYEPKLFVGQFEPGSSAQVLTMVPTGGSGGITDINLFTFADGWAAPLVDRRTLNRGVPFDVKFAEDFQVALFSGESVAAPDIALDVHSHKEDYVRMGIYDEDGHLLKSFTGMVDPFSLIKPVDEDGDGVYELHGRQLISGAYHADGLAVADTVWSLQDGAPKLESFQLQPYGDVTVEASE
jgi:hypothetical protein